MSIIVIVGVILLIIFLIPAARSWLSDDENYNAGILLIAFYGLIIALPVFSSQINNFQIQIDSVQASLQEMFNRQQTEVFSAQDARKFAIRSQNNGRYLEIPLKESPVHGSLTLWFVGMVQPPNWYEVIDHRVLLKMSYSNKEVEELFSTLDFDPIVATYIIKK